MADKITIDIFRNKSAEDFTKALADPEGKLETGSAAASVASVAAALLLRVASMTQQTMSEDEQVRYIVKNAETLRDYMVHLIDEDVKCRAPLHKALAEGKPREIEAARQPAVAICSEIVNMMCHCLDFLHELMDICPIGALHYLGESAQLAMAAINSARLYIVDMGDKSTDETYRFVTRRENDITLEQYAPITEEILNKVEAGI